MSALTIENLQERAYNIYSEINQLKEDLVELADEFTYHKDDNPAGLDKATVKLTMKVAEVDAGNSFEKLVEKRMEQQAFEAYFKQQTGYDS